MATSTDTLDAYPGARAAREHMVFDDDAQVADPGIGGPTGAVVIHLDGTARWALPKGTRIAPGKGKVYALGPSGRVHVLIVRDGRVRELVVGLAVARRIRVEMFGANA